jgi:nucleoid DNA-binding protein
MQKILIEAIHQRHGGMTREEAHDLLQLILGLIKDKLREGERIKIPNFGVFYTRPIKRKEVVNPRTGDTVTIKRKKTIVFKPAKRFSQVINEK